MKFLGPFDFAAPPGSLNALVSVRSDPQKWLFWCWCNYAPAKKKPSGYGSKFGFQWITLSIRHSLFELSNINRNTIYIHILMYIIYKTHAWHLNDWIICILAVSVAKYIIHGWHGTGHPGDIFHVATVTCYIHLPVWWPLGACAPLAAIRGFKSSTFPSSDCCLANCHAFIPSFRGIHGFLGTLHCFKLPSQPGQPARTGLSCHVEEHSFLGHLSIFQAFETRIQSENPIPKKLGIRGIWQTISQSNHFRS